jgi:hypothetical protein
VAQSFGAPETLYCKIFKGDKKIIGQQWWPGLKAGPRQLLRWLRLKLKLKPNLGRVLNAETFFQICKELLTAFGNG